MGAYGVRNLHITVFQNGAVLVRFDNHAWLWLPKCLDGTRLGVGKKKAGYERHAL